MKKTRRIFGLCLIMLMVMLFAAPVSAKTFKASNTKTAKKQINKMIDEMDFVTEAKLEKMKKGQTKTLYFNKKSDRDFATTYMYVWGTKDSAQTSRWFFGPNATKKAADEEFYDGTDHITLYPKSYKRNGNYYTVKCVAKMYVDSAGAKYYKSGNVTFKFKVYPHTHYGLILKSMKITRTAKVLRP